MSINVGGGYRNRTLALELFSFLDIVFVIDSPQAEDGGWKGHGDDGRDLFSFVKGCDVKVYVRSGLVGLFEIVAHDVEGVTILYEDGGGRKSIRGVYVRPEKLRGDWDRIAASWVGVDTICGDFNAWHGS